MDSWLCFPRCMCIVMAWYKCTICKFHTYTLIITKPAGSLTSHSPVGPKTKNSSELNHGAESIIQVQWRWRRQRARAPPLLTYKNSKTQTHLESSVWVIMSYYTYHNWLITTAGTIRRSSCNGWGHVSSCMVLHEIELCQDSFLPQQGEPG